MRLCSSFFVVVVLLPMFFLLVALIGVLIPINYVWLARASNLFGVPYEKER
jgi:hypothetical protein